MVKIMIAPNRYIQGPRVLKETSNYIAHLGSKVFFIAGQTALSVVQEQIAASLKAHAMEYQFEVFSGECTRASADQLAKKARTFGAEIVAGVGSHLGIDLQGFTFKHPFPR